METPNFIQHIRWLRNHLAYQKYLVLNAEGIELIKRPLLWQSDEILHQLELAEIVAFSTPRNMCHMPVTFYERYDTLVASMQQALGLSVQHVYMREGRMREAHITQDDVAANASCRICGQRFTEGMSVGVLRCSHKFHRTCVVGRYAVQAKCPICGQRI